MISQLLMIDPELVRHSLTSLETDAPKSGHAEMGYMNRSEKIRWLVLREISDDYENVDQVVLRGVREVGAKCGLTIERPDVLEALAGLIENGLAKAYLLSATKPFATEIEGMPALDIIEEDFRTYFYITKKGLDLHRSDDSLWPFEDA